MKWPYFQQNQTRHFCKIKHDDLKILPYAQSIIASTSVASTSVTLQCTLSCCLLCCGCSHAPLLRKCKPNPWFPYTFVYPTVSEATAPLHLFLLARQLLLQPFQLQPLLQMLHTPQLQAYLILLLLLHPPHHLDTNFTIARMPPAKLWVISASLRRRTAFYNA
jgi:hypothetical protein